MADKVVLMKDGRIQQVGTPDDLYNRPENTFVAEFVGAPPMALMNASVLSGTDEGLTIGIRAEDVSIAPAGEGRLSCEVRESEFLGSETQIGLELANTTGLTVMLPGLALRQAGEKIEITFEDKEHA